MRLFADEVAEKRPGGTTRNNGIRSRIKITYKHNFQLFFVLFYSVQLKLLKTNIGIDIKSIMWKFRSLTQFYDQLL